MSVPLLLRKRSRSATSPRPSRCTSDVWTILSGLRVGMWRRAPSGVMAVRKAKHSASASLATAAGQLDAGLAP